MGGRAGGRADGRMGRRMDGRTGRRADRRTNRLTDDGDAPQHAVTAVRHDPEWSWTRLRAKHPEPGAIEAIAHFRPSRAFTSSFGRISLFLRTLSRFASRSAPAKFVRQLTAAIVTKAALAVL